jgi:hypothetical protein
MAGNKEKGFEQKRGILTKPEGTINGLVITKKGVIYLRKISTNNRR